jgi:signal peptidase II
MIKTYVKYAFILLLLFGGCYADLLSKQWAKRHLKGKHEIVIVKGCVELGFTENRGMVFGIFNHDSRAQKYLSGLTVLRALILIVVTVFIIVQRKRSILYLLPFLFIWSGALGNLIDSVRWGHVVDFIHMHAGNALDWPFFFNVADAYVCVGMAILLLSGIFARKN